MSRINSPLAPKMPGGPLKVIVMGRISGQHQDLESVVASHREAETIVRSAYVGEIDFRFLGQRGSGLLTDRETILEAEALIETGEWDLAIAGDLARFYRNPRYQLAFVQNAVDYGTRVICLGDGLDTADENWEVMAGAAAFRHGLQIPDTRRRIKTKATYTFHQGGWVQKIRFGYRRLTKEEAASGQFGPRGLRIARVPDCISIIREMVRRILCGQSCRGVADWLNDEGILPGEYAVSKKWNGRLVATLLRSPLMHGERRFRVIRSQQIYKTGKYRHFRNPESPESEFYPELAQMTLEEHGQLIRILDERVETRTIARGKASPRYNIPRSRSIWPAQHTYCGVCGELLYRYGKNSVRCRNTLHGRSGCWNHVEVNCEVTRRKVLAALMSHFETVPTFRTIMIDAVMESAAKGLRKRGQREETLRKDLESLHKQANNFTEAIGIGGDIKPLVDRLAQISSQIKKCEDELAAAASDDKVSVILSREEVDAQLFDLVLHLARTSWDFADLMRATISHFEIRPIQNIENGFVRPRGVLRIDGDKADWDAPNQNSAASQTIELFVDLFDEPEYLRLLPVITAEKHREPQLSYRKIAANIGANYMQVKRTLRVIALMRSEGLSGPYRELHGPPETASRWRSRPKSPALQTKLRA